MSKRVRVYGGGETITTVSGEAPDSPPKGEVTVFGGAPTTSGILNKGEKQVGRGGDSLYPPVYGGGKAITNQKSPFPTRGSGDTGSGGGTIP